MTLFKTSSWIEWDQALSLGGTHLSPYVDVSHVRSRLDAYAETGGFAPARFDARTDMATDWRLGFNAMAPLTGNLNFVGQLEGVHRAQKSGASLTVTDVGGAVAVPTTLPGIKYDRNWVRAGVGLEGKLGGGTASVMLNGTTEGEAPSYWVTASWKLEF